MKKNSFIVSLILLATVIVVCIVAININSKTKKVIAKENLEYEKYLNNNFHGTDVITLINKAISDNEKNNVSKDEKGFYISNNKNSIKIDLVMVTDWEKEETTTYKMESISKVGITEFIKNFNIVEFKCTKKEYHSQTGKISYIEITQQSE